MRKLLIALLLAAANPLVGQNEIVGFWINESQDMVVEVYRDRDHFHGRIIWLKDSLDLYGQPLRDVMNKDPEYRPRMVKGLDILQDFEWQDGSWKRGRIYNHQNGRDYNGKIRLQQSADQLRLTGYYGILFFLGKVKKWQRLKTPDAYLSRESF